MFSPDDSGSINLQWKPIDLGNFDINQLPKLHREESDAQSLSNKDLRRISNVSRRQKVEVITTRIKLQSAFPNLQNFLSAWQIYISVRTQYHPEYNSSLAFWTERLIHRATIHPWNCSSQLCHRLLSSSSKRLSSILIPS